jgi:hypothetical protein
MVLPLRPLHGGFLRLFGCGTFIRDFLLGHAPEGSIAIDQGKGAVQTDIFYHYKLVLHRAYAQDAVAWENDERVKAGKGPYTEEEYTERVDWHLRRIPYKLVKCRYHSFIMYFGMLKKLGWVELTGEEEVSTPQDYYEGFAPRRYYRLTQKGIEAPDHQWSNPHRALYPTYTLEYYREKRREHKYVKKSPTKRRNRQNSSE